MKTAVIYARYSCDNQAEQSIEGQLRVCHDYAERNGILIVETYIDRAMTGTNDMRPAVLHHALEVRAHIVGTCHSAVDVGVHDQDPVSLGIVVTNAKLTFDGLLGLVVAGIPSVDDCCFHVAFSSVALDFAVWFCWR